MAINVTLRQKPLSKGRQRLYLDFYPAIQNPETGELSRRETLKEFLYGNLDKTGKLDKAAQKRLSPLEQAHDREAYARAEMIRQGRENELKKPEIYNEYEREQLRKKELGEQCFVAYFRALTNKRKAANYGSWSSALKYLETFTGDGLKFSDITEQFLSDFKEYLLTTKSNRSDKSTLSQNSAVSYFNKVKAALRQAYKDGILQTDLNAKVSPIKAAETKREHLTIDELNTLAKTPCNIFITEPHRNDLFRRVTLFAALTGVRYSDLEKMTWGELIYIEGAYSFDFRQQKTKGLEYLPISEQAYNLTGGAKNPKDMEQDKRVFEGLTYSPCNTFFKNWVRLAGITKRVTFHCLRHTFAILQLSNGTDIYTVSKMLGHKDLKTTQIYAKVVDKMKRTAADKIKLDF